MAVVTPTTKRIKIPHTSWKSSQIWWTQRLLSPIYHFLEPYFWPVPIPHKGPQVWKFPPPAGALNRWLHNGEQCVRNQWKDETSGWTMTIVSPPSAGGVKKETKRLIMYLHGSGFLSPISEWHWSYIGYLARELESEVVAVPYPLAPANNGLEVMPVLTQVYKEFLNHADGREVIVVGDRLVGRPTLYSAGGNLALCLAFSAHDAGLALPAQIVAISPGVDLNMGNPDMDQVAPYDVRLNLERCHKGGRLWAGVQVPPSVKPGSIPIPPEILASPHMNPIVGDLGIFIKHGTKLVIASGQWDILHPDLLLFVDKAEKAGVQMTYIEGEHQPHCFPVAVEFYPETKQAAELINWQVKANGRN